ncbi:hypothetical protein F4778DRAFT_749962, partial [Xylariomycetidae sp. FL2044]
TSNMQFSRSTLLQLVPFFLGSALASIVVEDISARAPAPQRLSELISQNEANGGVKWNDIDNHTQYGTLNTRSDIPESRDVGVSKRWVGIGDIFQEPAEATCYDNGEKVLTTVITDLVPDVCKTIAESTNQGKALNTVWNFVHKKEVPDEHGDLKNVLFGIKMLRGEHKNTDPSLTDNLCDLLFQKLFEGAPCNKDKDTHGGSLKLGNIYEVQADPGGKANPSGTGKDGKVIGTK